MKHETVVDMLRITTLVYEYDDTTSVFRDNTDYNSLLAKYPQARVVNFISDTDTDVQFGITINDSEKRICLVFRGSDAAADWRYNLQINKLFIKSSSYGDICIHKGYCKQLFITNLNRRKILIGTPLACD